MKLRPLSGSWTAVSPLMLPAISAPTVVTPALASTLTVSVTDPVASWMATARTSATLRPIFVRTAVVKPVVSTST